MPLRLCAPHGKETYPWSRNWVLSRNCPAKATHLTQLCSEPGGAQPCKKHTDGLHGILAHREGVPVSHVSVSEADSAASFKMFSLVADQAAFTSRAASRGELGGFFFVLPIDYMDAVFFVFWLYRHHLLSTSRL